MAYLDSSLDNLTRQRQQAASSPPPASADLAKQYGFSPSEIASMTHRPEQTGPVQRFIGLAQQPAPPRPPLPGEERINQALTRQDPRYRPAPPLPQQNWQRWGEEALSNIPFGFPGIMAGERGYQQLMNRSMSTGAMINPGQKVLGSLGMAKQMEQQGYGRSAIRQATSWYRDQTGWNHEIPDSGSSLNALKVPPDQNYLINQMTVKDVLNHSPLYSVYPYLRDIPLDFVNAPNKAYASYIFPDKLNPFGKIVVFNAHNRILDSVKKSILHELTHAIDKYEGRPVIGAWTGMTIDEYHNLISEARARNTEYRSDYPPEKLREPAMDPWETWKRMRGRIYDESDLLLKKP